MAVTGAPIADNHKAFRHLTSRRRLSGWRRVVAAATTVTVIGLAASASAQTVPDWLQGTWAPEGYCGSGYEGAVVGSLWRTENWPDRPIDYDRSFMAIDAPDGCLECEGYRFLVVNSEQLVRAAEGMAETWLRCPDTGQPAAPLPTSKPAG